MTVNRQIILAKRPTGMPGDENLKLQEGTVPEVGEGQVLVRTIYLSLDPYMRGRMSAAKSYAASVEEGSVMEGATVGQVVESRSGDFKQGDYVLCPGGWQEYSVNSPKAMRKLDPAQAPISTAVGVLGMPGFTAYVGLDEIGKPQKGETVVVSAAAGAVGQVVGQIAKLKGCRVVGVAGAEDKCKHVVGAYGFDACVNYKDADFREQLAKACPDGIDVYFENVGGDTFDAVMELVNDFARIPVCGRIAHYNDTEMPQGPDRLPGFMGKVLVKRLLIKGFIQFDYIHRQGDFLKDMPVWISEGKVKYQEDVVEGLENAVSAFQGLLQGKNRGKLLIQVGDDPTKK
ncbi:MAG TPA: NADP-dependent oxidoreductase [Alcanivorax sp.]|nr:NADP-dependent oxidoreductase [Alcanivorax sp.]HAI34188.1 NADP-dependent oxidoreductase [Alcanivorax sp.]HAI89233.1 NADP-dependent oxidoreductase [Alcanivorax sp.]HBP91996.1 NADP-dependent oxidoreductase [Alcanivorax sp.]HCD76173.1 NADP-dependent oxidoreductase [Alcanivorax sp.]|tara:strand:+ start:259 stop:1290 length:1032 start_codon:yes stop_codon:yes gene_type:complete